MIYGFLRETKELAQQAGPDKDTGLPRTGLEEYLRIIYPDVTDWIHDCPIGEMYKGKVLRIRPDYKSDSLKMVVEFDGIQHYQHPDTMLKDDEKTEIYKELGYRVVRIPFFIQLTKDAVLKLFGVRIEHELFDGRYPSLGVKGRCTPAFLCPAGIERMAREFVDFPDQYKTNLCALLAANNDFVSGASLLAAAYDKVVCGSKI